MHGIDTGPLAHDLVEDHCARALGRQGRRRGAVQHVGDTLAPLLRAVGRPNAAAPVAALEEGYRAPDGPSRVDVGHGPGAQVVHFVVEIGSGSAAHNVALERRADLDEAARTVVDLTVQAGC